MGSQTACMVSADSVSQLAAIRDREDGNILFVAA